MSGTHMDITDRVTAQEEVRALNAGLELRVAQRTADLERTLKDMEAISYSIAHDLRAPLRAVNGFAAVIAESDTWGLWTRRRATCSSASCVRRATWGRCSPTC